MLPPPFHIAYLICNLCGYYIDLAPNAPMLLFKKIQTSLRLPIVHSAAAKRTLYSSNNKAIVIFPRSHHEFMAVSVCGKGKRSFPSGTAGNVSLMSVNKFIRQFFFPILLQRA